MAAALEALEALGAVHVAVAIPATYAALPCGRAPAAAAADEGWGTAAAAPKRHQHAVVLAHDEVLAEEVCQNRRNKQKTNT